MGVKHKPGKPKQKKHQAKEEVCGAWQACERLNRRVC